jgi:hypothetical protein
MDDETLFACLKHLLTRSNKVKTFKVLANDEQELIDHKNIDSAYIINTSKRGDPHAPLKHWFVVYITREGNNKLVAEVFDSYGEDVVSKYHLNISIKLKTVNNKAIQPLESNKCGLYCLYYIYKRSIGYSASQVISLFSTRYPNLNDSIVSEFYGNIKRYPGSVKRSNSNTLDCCTRLQNKLLK